MASSQHLLIRLFQQTARIRGVDSGLAQHIVLCRNKRIRKSQQTGLWEAKVEVLDEWLSAVRF